MGRAFWPLSHVTARESAQRHRRRRRLLPHLETLQLLASGKSFEEIAQIRGRQVGTVVNAVAALVERGELEFSPEWIDRNKLAVIEAACSRVGVAQLERLKTLKDALPAEITYDEIRLVVARLRREQITRRARPHKICTLSGPNLQRGCTILRVLIFHTNQS